MLARVWLREPAKFDQLGLGRFKGEAEPPQSMTQSSVEAKGVRAILEAHHKVVDVSHQAGFAPQSRLDHPLEPQIEHMMQIQITQQDADRPALWSSPSFGWTSPSSSIPAFSQRRIRLIRRKSPTRCSTNRSIHSWFRLARVSAGAARSPRSGHQPCLAARGLHDSKVVDMNGAWFTEIIANRQLGAAP